MKTLNDFTPEIKAKIPLYKERILKNLCNGKEYETNKLEDTIKYVHKIYELTEEYSSPLVIVAKNPKEFKLLYSLIPYILQSPNYKLDDALYIKLSSKLGNLLPQSIDSLNESLVEPLNQKVILNPQFRDLISDSPNMGCGFDDILVELSSNITRSSWAWYCSIYSRVYLTWFKFVQDEFNIDHPKKEILNELYELINKTFISRCYFTRPYVLILKTPKKIFLNEDNVLHNVSGPSYSFDGDEDSNFYNVNGREVPREFIEGVITKEMFMEETNEDLKACMVTIIQERHGNDGLLKFLNAELIDEQYIQHLEDYGETVRLYKTKEKYSFLQDRFGILNQPFCWTEIKCPSTQTTYLIDNSADFTDALEALKFIRPSFVPAELTYQWDAFAN